MRWKYKEPAADLYPGEHRKRNVFAWRPTKVNKCVVWLERYAIHEVVVVDDNDNPYWLEIERTTLDYYY